MLMDLVLMAIIFPCLVFIFWFTPANLLYCVFGFVALLAFELVLLLIYCIFKLQHVYLDSNKMEFVQNSQLQLQKKHPFKQQQIKNKFFYNLYTQEAKIFQKRNSLKVTNFDIFWDEEEIKEIRSRVHFFLKEFNDYYEMVNKLNEILVQFGLNLSQIQKKKWFVFSQEFVFSQLDQFCSSTVPKEQLNSDEIQTLKAAKIILRQDTSRQGYILPSWSNVIRTLQFVGAQFTNIQQMRVSNQQMFKMMTKKIRQDSQFIANELQEIGEKLENTQQRLSQLKIEQDENQAQQNFSLMQGDEITDMINWMKKKYNEFTNLQLRIKQNQKNYKVQTEKLKYYKEKASKFIHHNRRKHTSTLKTLFTGFLDSYHITIAESISRLKNSLKEINIRQQKGPPKVRKLIQSKLVNQILQNERAYQENYFRRVQYFINRINEFLLSLEDIDCFMAGFQSAFCKLIEGFPSCSERKSISYFVKLITELQLKSVEMYQKIHNLKRVNQKLKICNQNILSSIKAKLEQLVQQCKSRLSSINENEGVVIHRYKIIKVELSRLYKQIQQNIKRVQQFENIYKSHSQRVKKIILFSLMDYLLFQKRAIDMGTITHRNFTDDAIDQSYHFKQENDEDLAKDMQQDNQSLLTGFQLTDQYVGFFNKFLFVAFTEWKKSRFFKETLKKELYILLNSDPLERVGQIIVDDIKMEGLPPKIFWIRELKSEEQQFLADVNLAIKGKLSVTVKTIYKFIVNVPLEVILQVGELYSIVRICYVPASLGRSWFTFIGQPNAKIKIRPIVGSYALQNASIVRIFENLVLNKLKQACFPIRQKIEIPLSKEDKNLQNIRKRFQNNEEYS